MRLMKTATATPTVTIRLLEPTDPISDVTHLLHRAYAPQVAMGLKPLAGRQDDSITRERCENSECFLAILGGAPPGRPAKRGTPAAKAAPNGKAAPGAIVGVILLDEQEKASFPAFFLRPDVCHFAQFAVDPDKQGLGIGRLLLERVEGRAREKGAAELALSMAEPDTKLADFYLKRGFRFVEHWQWPYTNYRSCILSKRLID